MQSIFGSVPEFEQNTQPKKMPGRKQFHVARRRSRQTVAPYPARRPFAKRPVRATFSSWECLQFPEDRSEEDALLKSFCDQSPTSQHRGIDNILAKLRAVDPCLANQSCKVDQCQRSNPAPSFCRMLKDLPLSRLRRTRYRSPNAILGVVKSHNRHLATEDLPEIEDEYDDLSDDYDVSEDEEKDCEWFQSKEFTRPTFLENDVELSDVPDDDDTEFSVADETSLCRDSSDSYSDFSVADETSLCQDPSGSSGDFSFGCLERISTLHLGVPPIPPTVSELPLPYSQSWQKQEDFSIAFPSHDQSDFAVAMEVES
eukprot:g7203.t1